MKPELYSNVKLSVNASNLVKSNNEGIAKKETIKIFEDWSHGYMALYDSKNNKYKFKINEVNLQLGSLIYFNEDE